MVEMSVTTLSTNTSSSSCIGFLENPEIKQKDPHHLQAKIQVLMLMLSYILQTFIDKTHLIKGLSWLQIGVER